MKKWILIFIPLLLLVPLASTIPENIYSSPTNTTYYDTDVNLTWENITGLTNATFYIDGGSNESLYAAGGASVLKSFDISGQITREAGLYQNGTNFFVLDTPVGGPGTSCKVYLYTMDGTYASKSFDVYANNNLNGNCYGITGNNTYFWLTDWYDDKVYMYNSDFSYTGTSWSTYSKTANARPRGIDTDGTYIWLADYGDNEVYKYEMNGTFAETLNADSVGSLGYTNGVVEYNNFIWFVDSDSDKVYKSYEHGTYTNVSFDFSDGIAIETNGTYFWILNSTANKVEMIDFYDTSNFDNVTMFLYGGSHNVTTVFTDASGNNGTTINFTVQPTMDILSPTNTTYYDLSISFNVTSNLDVDTWLYSINDTSNVTLTANTTVTFGAGIFDVVFFVNDTNGNYNSTTVYFSTDSVPPQLRLTSPTNTTYPNEFVNINVDANETVDTWIFELDGNGTNVTFTPNITISVRSGGAHDIQVCANDSLDNMNCTTVYFSINNTPALITISSPSNTTYNVTQDLNVTYDKDVFWSYFSLNGASNVTMDFNWTNTVIDSSDSPSKVSIGVNSTGQPAIAYTNSTGSLLYVYYDGSVWNTETVDKSTNCNYPDLEFNSTNGPVIAYNDGANTEYAQRGTVWSSVTAKTSSGAIDLDLELNSTDYPRIVWYNSGTGYIGMVNYTGSAWTELKITTDTSGAYATSIAFVIDSADKPTVFYTSSHVGFGGYTWDLIYRSRWDGSVWQNDTVYESYDGGACGLGGCGICGYEMSASITSYDYPAVMAFCYQGGGSDTDARFFNWTGAAWVRMDFDIGTQQGTYGWYTTYGGTDIVFDSANYPHVVYGPDMNVYSKHNSTQWINNTLSGNSSIYYTSIVLDSNDFPFIVHATGHLEFEEANKTMWGALYTPVIGENTILIHVNDSVANMNSSIREFTMDPIHYLKTNYTIINNTIDVDKTTYWSVNFTFSNNDTVSPYSSATVNCSSLITGYNSTLYANYTDYNSSKDFPIGAHNDSIVNFTATSVAEKAATIVCPSGWTSYAKYCTQQVSCVGISSTQERCTEYERTWIDVKDNESRNFNINYTQPMSRFNQWSVKESGSYFATINGSTANLTLVDDGDNVSLYIWKNHSASSLEVGRWTVTVTWTWLKSVGGGGGGSGGGGGGGITAVCGNGVCEWGETEESCVQDCGNVSFRVIPQNYEVPIGAGSIQTIEVVITNDEEEDLIVELYSYGEDESKEWLFAEESIEVLAKSSKVVPVEIVVPETATDGDYYANVMFQSGNSRNSVSFMIGVGAFAPLIFIFGNLMGFLEYNLAPPGIRAPLDYIPMWFILAMGGSIAVFSVYSAGGVEGVRKRIKGR